MGKISRITEPYFYEVKRYSRWHTSRRTAAKFGIHISTAMNIAGCRNYEQYRELVRAEHQPTKFSLREGILELHKQVFDKNDNKYIEPSVARTALTQIQFELGKKK